MNVLLSWKGSDYNQIHFIPIMYRLENKKPTYLFVYILLRLLDQIFQFAE